MTLTLLHTERQPEDDITVSKASPFYVII